jgi:hypothetical protein
MGSLELLPLCNSKRLLLDAHITVCSIRPFHIVGGTGSYSILPRSVVLGAVYLPSSDRPNFLPLRISISSSFAKDNKRYSAHAVMALIYFLILLSSLLAAGQGWPFSIVHFFHSKIPRRIIIMDKPYVITSLLSIFNTLSNNMLTIPPSYFYLEL